MSARWPWFLLAICLFFLAMVWQAPSWLAANLLSQASQGQLTLADPQGSLWSGRGRLLLKTPQEPLVLVDHLAWQLDPRGLLQARVRLSLEIDASAAGEISFRRDGLEAQGLKFTLPAEVLSALPQLAKARPAGALAIDIPALVWAIQDSSGGGRILWQQASVQLGGNVVRWRGEVTVDLAARENLLSLTTAVGSPLPLRLELRRNERGISSQLAPPAP